MTELEIKHSSDDDDWEVWLSDFVIIGLGETVSDALADAIAELQALTTECVERRDALKTTTVGTL